MKSTLLAVTLAGIVASAYGQSEVKIYGIIDLSTGVTDSGSAKVYNLSSGVGNSTRLGFRGTEDLGGGLKANFKLEMGIAADTGALTQGGTAFGRESWVGLSGSGWSVSAGRQYSPLLFVMATNDASGQAYWGSSQNAGIGLQESPGSGPGTGGHTAVGRVNNSIYGTTALGPVNLMGMVAMGDENSKGSGRLVSLGGIYRQDALTLGAGAVRFRQYEQAIAPTANPEWQTTYTVGGSYDFKIVKLFAGYYSFDPADNRPAGTPTSADPRFLKTNSYWLGARVPAGNGNFFANVMRTKYVHATAPDGVGATLSFAYEYYLSKRTVLYTSYGQVNNSATALVPLLGAATVVFPAKAGDDPKALSFGVRHSF